MVFHSRGCIKFDSQQSLPCSAGTRTAVAGETAGQEERSIGRAELSKERMLAQHLPALGLSSYFKS